MAMPAKNGNTITFAIDPEVKARIVLGAKLDERPLNHYVTRLLRSALDAAAVPKVAKPAKKKPAKKGKRK